MANHGWVKTRKVVTDEKINEMFADLNTRVFNGKLRIESYIGQAYCSDRDVTCWTVSYYSHGKCYASRTCHLESSRHFEVRHSSGATFAWWLDVVCLNEVAVLFNGTIYDDGVDDKIKGVPNKYDDFADFVKLMFKHHKPALKRVLLKFERTRFPTEYRNRRY